MPTFSRYSLFLLLFSSIALIGLGLVMLASTSPWAEPEHMAYSHVKKQMFFLGIGLIGALISAKVPLHLFERFYWFWLLCACAVLSLCYVPGIQVTVNGASRWIKMPLLGQFQPSEPAKIACIVMMAGWMTKHQLKAGSFWKGFVFPLTILAVPSLLVFCETDMGTTAVIVGSGFLLLYTAGSRPFLLVGAIVLALVGLYFVVTLGLDGGNRAARLLAFQDLESTKLGYGLQQWRSLLAFASGGVQGVGLGNGAEKHGYLPFAHTDFIYPIIGEELGLVATLGVILAFVLIAIAGILIASRSKSHFAALMAVGLTANLVIPAAMNIAVTTAMLPNTGLPLPFVSYGGSNLIFAMVSVGLLVNIYFGSPNDANKTVTTRIEKRIMRV